MSGGRPRGRPAEHACRRRSSRARSAARPTLRSRPMMRPCRAAAARSCGGVGREVKQRDPERLAGLRDRRAESVRARVRESGSRLGHDRDALTCVSPLHLPAVHDWLRAKLIRHRCVVRAELAVGRDRAAERCRPEASRCTAQRSRPCSKCDTATWPGARRAGRVPAGIKRASVARRQPGSSTVAQVMRPQWGKANEGAAMTEQHPPDGEQAKFEIVFRTTALASGHLPVRVGGRHDRPWRCERRMHA